MLERPPSEAAPGEFLALEGRSGNPLYLRPRHIVGVMFDEEGCVSVETETGASYLLSERSGRELCEWLHERSAAPHAG